MALRLRGWLGILALLLLAGEAAGQPSTKGSAAGTGGSIGTALDRSPDAGTPLIRIAQETGVPRSELPPTPPAPLPLGAPAAPATRVISSAIDPEAPPPFHVSALKLDGQVSGDQVQFTVDIDVEINRTDDAYYDVPLRLSQAHLVEKSYTGPGKEGPAPSADGDDGLHWRFSGAGTHHLKLKLWVPIRRTGGTNSLVLSLPQLPPFFDAQFKVRIPGKRITVRVPKETLLGDSKSDAEATEVVGSVRGTRLEVTWNESSADVPAIGRVTTLMTLKRDADRLVLQGEQTIQRERTPASGDIFVKMPSAGQLVELISPHVRMHEPATNRPGWRRVVLQETAPDRIDLRWLFDMPFPSAGGRITVDGLEVAEARVQEGGVQLADFGTHLAIPRLNESPLVLRRVDVSTTRSAVPIVNAFEFVKQPFALVLDIQKVQPKFSVRPAHWLLIRADEMLLESVFQIEVENGALSELPIAWPSARADGWRIDTTSPGLFDLTPAEAEAALSTGSIPIRLRAPTTGKFEVRLRFRRSAIQMGQEVTWTLPRIPAGRGLPSQLVVAGDDNVLPQVQPDPQATEEATSGTSLAPPAEFVDLPQTTYRLSPRAEGVFKARASLKKREVDVGATISVTRQAGRGLLVRQLMHYKVKFGRISAVRVQLPEQLASRIPVGAEQAAVAARLATTGTGGSTPLVPVRDESRLDFALPSPRIGEFDVVIEYTYPLDADVSQTVDIDVPILLLAEGKFSSVRCVLPDGEGLSIVDRSMTWEPIPTAPESAIWFSATNPQTMPIRVTGSLRQESQRYSIETAFHNVRFDGSGASVTYSEYHLRTPPARIALTIPVGAEQASFEWNDRTLAESAGDLRTDPSLPGRYLIELRASDLVGEGRLRLIYREPPLSAAGSSWRLMTRRTVDLPQFPPNVWIASSVCEIDLPRDTHLLQSPAALLPEFHWARQGAIWARVGSSRYLDSRPQLVTTAEFHKIDLAPRGYAFSGMGPIERFSFTAMNRTLIVLIGAGLSLVLGFLFWRLPGTRNAQTFLIVAFTVSLLSLWFLEPIQVLLQPAILGGLLAVAASFLDTRSRTPEWHEPSQAPVRIPPPTSPPPPSASAPAVPIPGQRDSRPSVAAVGPTAIYQPLTSTHDPR